MNNKIIIAVVAVIVVGAGAWYFTMMRSGGVVIPGQVINNPETMAALIAAGRPVKCTVTPSADNGNMSGTFYLSGKKVRGDYSVNTGNQAMSGHMIVDGDTTYSWFEGQPMGFKMMNKVEANANVNVPAAGNQAFDPNKMMGYKCEGWSSDASKFALPAGVKFSDFGSGSVAPTLPVNGSGGVGASVNGSAGAGVGAGVTGNAAQCAACDGVPASYRSQCRSSLGCK